MCIYVGTQICVRPSLPKDPASLIGRLPAMTESGGSHMHNERIYSQHHIRKPQKYR